MVLGGDAALALLCAAVPTSSLSLPSPHLCNILRNTMPFTVQAQLRVHKMATPLCFRHQHTRGKNRGRKLGCAAVAGGGGELAAAPRAAWTTASRLHCPLDNPEAICGCAGPIIDRSLHRPRHNGDPELLINDKIHSAIPILIFEMND